MDSGNSGSISSSGDEEYDSSSRGADHDHQTLLHPTTFLNNQLGSLISSSSSHYHHHNHPHPSLFDLSPSYLHHALSQSQPTNSFLNLESRSTPNNCTQVPPTLQGLSSLSSSNQFPLGPHHQGLATDPSLQLLSVHNDENARAVIPSSSSSQGKNSYNNNDNNNNNGAAARNSKKRTRASRRAPTTVLTTDTSNFRAMVQEFTGIPAPPFSGSSYSRRLDLLTGSSSLRSSASHHLDNITTIGSFYPLRPSPQKIHNHQNPLLIPSSSSSPPPSSQPLLHSNMIDALASSTANNVTSSATTNNNASSNNSINYQLPPDLGLPYHHHQQQQNMMLSMQNHHHPIIGFHPPPPIHHHLPAGFSAKSSQMPISFENLGMSHGHDVNAHHNLVGSEGEGMPLRNVNSDDDDGCRDGGEGGRRDPLRSFDGGYGSNNNNNNIKVASTSAAASDLNHEKGLLENNTSTSRGGETGAVDSWICSSD